MTNTGELDIEGLIAEAREHARRHGLEGDNDMHAGVGDSIITFSVVDEKLGGLKVEIEHPDERYTSWCRYAATHVEVVRYSLAPARWTNVHTETVAQMLDWLDEHLAAATSEARNYNES
jgi:hypothetical protein